MITLVELLVKDNQTGAYFKIPMLPEKIEYKDGEKKAHSIEVLDLGDVEIPSGVALDSIGWSSMFPSRYDSSYCTHPDIHPPLTYRNQFSSWKDAGTSLQIICPVFGINKTMYLKSFEWAGEGFECDISYRVEFRELKTITPRKIAVGGVAPAQGTKGPEDRASAPQTPNPTTYTVVSGDTLVHLAKRFGFTDWRKQLYEPNKSVIGSDPNKLTVGVVLRV